MLVDREAVLKVLAGYGFTSSPMVREIERLPAKVPFNPTEEVLTDCQRRLDEFDDALRTRDQRIANLVTAQWVQPLDNKINELRSEAIHADQRAAEIEKKLDRFISQVCGMTNRVTAVEDKTSAILNIAKRGDEKAHEVAKKLNDIFLGWEEIGIPEEMQ